MVIIVGLSLVKDLWTIRQVTNLSRAGHTSARSICGCCDSQGIRHLLSAFVLKQMCEMLAPLYFGTIFSFDVFLWNKRFMYQLEDVTHDQACLTLNILLVNFIFQLIMNSLYACYLLRDNMLDHNDRTFLNEFMQSLVGRWLWHLILLSASITTIAGACMILKHDGMDMSFRFEWLRD